MSVSRWRDEQYVRQARRVRAEFARQPALMHKRLQALAGVAEEPQILPERDFVTIAKTRIQVGILRYSDRQELMVIAQRMGISRFDANLLIASAQHHCARRAIQITSKRARRWQLIAMAIVVQAAILSGFFWLIR